MPNERRVPVGGRPGTTTAQRLHDERGEGVISAAIAVLIIALLGAAMWVIFSDVMDGAAERIEESVESIG